MGIFKNKVASAAGNADRRPSPKLGRVIVLLDSAKYVEASKNQVGKDFFKANCTVVKGLEDVDGRSQDDEGYLGDKTGDEVGLFYMAGAPKYISYFHNDLQAFGFKCLNITKKDFITDEDKAKGTEGITMDEFEETFLPEILGITPDGEDIEAGMCDGSVLLEIRTYFKPNKDGEKDDEGNIKGYDTPKIVRNVPFSEVLAMDLTDSQISRVFGSIDQLTHLISTMDD